MNTGQQREGRIKVVAEVRRRIEKCADFPDKTPPPYLGGYGSPGL